MTITQHTFVDSEGMPVHMEQRDRFKVLSTEVFVAEPGGLRHEQRVVFIHTVQRKVPIEVLANGR